MDYKTIINQLNTLKSDYISYFNERKQKNERTIYDIIESYKESLLKGNISLQSFKTRILHNGHNVEKLIPIINNRVNSLNVDLGEREDFMKVSSLQKVSPTKKYDLQEFTVENRKRRHEINNKISALRRELGSKKDENESLLRDSIKAHEQNVVELTKAMNQKIHEIEVTMKKDVNAAQLVLLTENEKSKIEELKKQVASIRHDSLTEQFETKEKFLNQINDEKIIIITETEKSELLSQKVTDEVNIAINNLNLELEILSSTENAKNTLYDFENEINNNDNVFDKKIECLQLIKNHNNKILTLEDVYIVFDRIKINVLQAIIVAKEENQYNPYIKVYEKLYELLEEIQKLFTDCYNELNNKITQYKDEIYNSFDEVTKNMAFKRNRSKDVIKENILDCLKLLYENESKLYDSYLFATYELMSRICFNACEILSEEINNLGYSKLLITEYGYDFDFEKFGYQKINFKDEEKYQKICDKNNLIIEEISNAIDVAFNKNTMLNDIVDNQIDDFIKKNNVELEKIINNGKKEADLMEKSLQKLVYNIDKNILVKEKELKKKQRLEISKEKKSLQKILKLLA